MSNQEAATKDLDPVIDDLGLMNWEYDRFFDPFPKPVYDFTGPLENLVAEARLDEHPFFRVAERSQTALFLWVSQELVMTNAFSQLVLAAAAKINNVHARAILTEIAFGEHNQARAGFAKFAHPWLLERMRSSIGLKRSQVHPQMPTINFIRRLATHINDPLEAVAFIGIGNERLIEPEYKAIRRCFENLTPDADFEPFLKANIEEDVTHSRLCYELAALLVRSEAEEKSFLEASRASIRSRMTYFDELLALAQQR